MVFLKLLQIKRTCHHSFKWRSTIQCRKGLSNANEKAAIAGGIAAHCIHTLAEAYGATVILHTDHCAKNYCLGLTDY
jgi:phenylpyruvate tautomerase PptA (4-oxalocrotonate tautomerase family)